MERSRTGKLGQHLQIRMCNGSGGQGKKLEEWGKGYKSFRLGEPWGRKKWVAKQLNLIRLKRTIRCEMPVRKKQATLGLVILIFWIGQNHSLYIRLGKSHFKKFNLAKIRALH